MFRPPPAFVVSVRHHVVTGQRGSDVIVTHHRLSWQCHSLEDYAMLWSKSRWAGLGLSLGARYTQMGILKLAAWDPRLWCNETSAVARGLFLMTGASAVSSISPVWGDAGVLASCVCVINSQSHTPMIYLLFVPIILEFKRCRHGDKREPNDPFVWATTNACIPPGRLGE